MQNEVEIKIGFRYHVLSFNDVLKMGIFTKAELTPLLNSDHVHRLGRPYTVIGAEDIHARKCSICHFYYLVHRDFWLDQYPSVWTNKEPQQANGGD